MNQLLRDLGVKESTPCGYCNESLAEAEQWVMLTRPSNEGGDVLTTVFCSLSCWYRFCENMMVVVARATTEIASGAPPS